MLRALAADRDHIRRAYFEDLKAYHNFLTYGQGGASFEESQWLDKLRAMEERAERAEAALAETFRSLSVTPTLMERTHVVEARVKELEGDKKYHQCGTPDACCDGTCSDLASAIRLLEEAEQRAASLEAVLVELVALKVLKDSQGKTPEYEERQPRAWKAARDALTKKGGEK